MVDSVHLVIPSSTYVLDVEREYSAQRDVASGYVPIPYNSTTISMGDNIPLPYIVEVPVYLQATNIADLASQFAALVSAARQATALVITEGATTWTHLLAGYKGFEPKSVSTVIPDGFLLKGTLRLLPSELFSNDQVSTDGPLVEF